nr:MAG TPA_asm: hypothetical protein [Caudoviricetes sp.]
MPFEIFIFIPSQLKCCNNNVVKTFVSRILSGVERLSGFFLCQKYLFCFVKIKRTLLRQRPK